ncbi:hypothetical protein [Neobacillus niacini]|uniref:hypothetical protein n=1 Tax=Neobacillus niacini TaxID=86668 RepID=UPI0005EE52BD|nr:hypothetical protein [Neobacillus niacini]
MNDNRVEIIKEVFSEEELSELKTKGEQQPHITALTKSLYETIITQYRENLKNTNYTVNNGHLCFKKSADEYVPLCNFIPFITRETVEDDGVDRKLMYHVSGVMAQQESIFPEIYLPAENFPSMNWVQSSWGLRANIEPGFSVKDKIRHAAQSISIDCSRDNIFTHIGWRKVYGEWIYLHAGGAIGKENITVKLESNQLEKYQLPADEVVDLKKAALASLELLKTVELEVTLPLIAMVGLAPLCEPLRKAGIEPAFVLWLSGPSGSKKSSLAACFQSHFGAFSSGKDLPASFRDTMNAIEKKAFLTKDTLLVVDDYHPTYSSQESKRMEQIAQQILRGYGDRVGRSRMKADTSLHKSYPPRGICLITGEDTPKAGISTTARFLEIELTSESINLERLKTSQEKNSYYSYAFKGYIQWLLPQMEQLPAMLKGIFNEHRSRFLNINTHGRVTETISWLLVGLEMLLSFYVHVQAIDKEQKEKTLALALEKLGKIAKKHALNLNSHDPAMLFTEGLRDLINTKSVTIIDIKDDPYSDDRHFIGWEDHEFYYLVLGNVMKEINLYFQGQGLRFPITKYMLSKMLAERQMIEVDRSENEVRNIVRAYVGKRQKQTRVMKLKKSALL